ncbi:hypothetical protein XENORESO_020830 [Xenotaenia resolanae]|uniref:Uncharacterized protein n=1 Tax=Xenotaenia resolanae TaxID=208358 RepID=A0ABV0WSA8_9TELE
MGNICTHGPPMHYSFRADRRIMMLKYPINTKAHVDSLPQSPNMAFTYKRCSEINRRVITDEGNQAGFCYQNQNQLYCPLCTPSLQCVANHATQSVASPL